MHFKLLIAFVGESKTNMVIDIAKKEGATGATVINHAHGEGIHPCKTFLGLLLQVQYDVIFCSWSSNILAEVFWKRFVRPVSLKHHQGVVSQSRLISRML